MLSRNTDRHFCGPDFLQSSVRDDNHCFVPRHSSFLYFAQSFNNVSFFFYCASRNWITAFCRIIANFEAEKSCYSFYWHKLLGKKSTTSQPNISQFYLLVETNRNRGYFHFLLNIYFLVYNIHVFFLVWRDSGVSLNGQISRLPEQPCWLCVLITLHTATLTPPQKVLTIGKLVELKTLDFSDHTRTGISILISAADQTSMYE